MPKGHKDLFILVLSYRFIYIQLQFTFIQLYLHAIQFTFIYCYWTRYHPLVFCGSPQSAVSPLIEPPCQKHEPSPCTDALCSMLTDGNRIVIYAPSTKGLLSAFLIMRLTRTVLGSLVSSLVSDVNVGRFFSVFSARRLPLFKSRDQVTRSDCPFFKSRDQVQSRPINLRGIKFSHD